MLEKCNLSKNNSILVIGCLNGYSLAILSNLVSYVFGIENKKTVDYASENFKQSKYPKLFGFS